MSTLLGKLPGMADLPNTVRNKVNDGEFMKLAAIIDSMTPRERQFPAVIKGLAQETHCQRLGNAGARRQPVAQTVQSDAEDDKEDVKKRRREESYARAASARIPGAMSLAQD